MRSRIANHESRLRRRSGGHGDAEARIAGGSRKIARKRGDGMTGYLLVMAIVILAGMPWMEALANSIAKLMDSTVTIDNVQQ